MNGFNPIRSITIFLFMGVMFIVALLTSCASVPAQPNNIENICSIFEQYPNWYRDAKRTELKWGVPVYVQMSIIYQESSFSGNAKPPRRKLLWIIPWKRPSSAYGYSQALKETWQRYVRETNQEGDRDEFGAASDFIGWYSAMAYIRCGIKPYDTYHLYLAYHEGLTNYENHTYWLKTWLILTSKKVANRALVYKKQLASCEYKLRY